VKNVKVSEENHKRLSKIGGVLDSMNDVIGMLLDEHERKGKK
jgi:hypothetical protein